MNARPSARRLLDLVAPLVTFDHDGALVQGDRVDTGGGPLDAAIAHEFYTRLHVGRRELDGLTSLRLRDEALEQSLAEAVPHAGVVLTTTTAPGTTLPGRVPAAAPDPVVVLDGVRVRVPRSAVLDGDPDTTGAELVVRVPSVRPAASPGFLYVMGSRHDAGTGGTVRLYLHVLDAEVAVELWRLVLTALEDAGVSYTAKILSHRVSYPRADAIVVYLDAGPTADTVDTAVQAVQRALDGRSGLGDHTSLFAERIAPGIALAAQPVDDRIRLRGLSFGQHRALLLARALVRGHQDGTDRYAVLLDEFAAGRVDPASAARNRPERTAATGAPVRLVQSAPHPVREEAP